MTQVPITSARKAFKDGIQTAWDATSLSRASECQRKYFYTMIEGWSTKAMSVHLLFGSIYASSLELYYKRAALGDSHDEAVISTLHYALTASWDAAANRPKDFLDGRKTRFALIRSIVWYLDQFGIDSGNLMQTYHLHDGSPAVELSFQYELTEHILLTGHLDRVVVFGDDLYILDQKTTGATITPYFFHQFKPSHQIYNYTLAGKIVFKTPIRGIIIDAAQIAVGFTRFERQPILVDDEQLVEWQAEALQLIDQTQVNTVNGKFPMNPTACGNYGGCIFRDVCASPPRLRKSALLANFVRETWWDPLENR